MGKNNRTTQNKWRVHIQEVKTAHGPEPHQFPVLEKQAV